jgi:hypothetical protein
MPPTRRLSSDGLHTLFDCLNDDDFVRQHSRTLTAFTRRRKLTFSHLVAYLLNQHKGAYQRELDDLFAKCWDDPTSVSAAAFCNARKNLRPEVFHALNRRLIDQVAQTLPIKSFYGLRVFAVDSTTLNLPHLAIMRSHYGGATQRGLSYPMARCSMLFDVSTRLTWDSALLPYGIGEAVAAADHLPHLPEGSVTLYDRGYPSFFLFKLHELRQRHVCMRVPRGFSKQTDALFANAKSPTKVTLQANADALELCQEHHIQSDAMTLRAVRVELATEVEVLLTSLLDRQAYPDAAFQDLYHQRWAIEDDFRHLKSPMQLENWSGKSVITVEQDVAARMLAKNLVAYVIACAQSRLDAKFEEAIAAGESVKPRQVNRTEALHRCKFVLIAYLLWPSPEALEPVIERVMRQTLAVKAGRSFPRNKHRGKSNRYPYAFKHTA